jgi:molybdopterin-containing oxidoreductase family iron-sulfur binding subunit
MGKKKVPEPSEQNDIQNVVEASRRDFIKKAGISGAAVLSGAAAIIAGYSHEKAKNKESFVWVLTTDNKLMKVPVEQTEGYKLDLKTLQRLGREGIPGKKWIMVIDLSKCRNARKCIEACQAAHHLRPYEYHINTLVMQESVNTPPYFMPKPCQHCDNPPCVSVCPVDATFKRQDGVVLIDNERCIGCRFCMAACPYSARIFHWKDPRDAEADKDKTYNIELNIPQKKGTITKCVLSSDRIRENQLPYCVSSCPNGVYYFGDENEDAVTNGTTKETVSLSELLKNNNGYHLMPELGTKPRVIYLPPKNRIFDFDKEKPDEKDFIVNS